MLVEKLYWLIWRMNENNKTIICRGIQASDLEKMADFAVRDEGGFLADYLAYKKNDGGIFSPALCEEELSKARTYIVENCKTGELIAYFTLKAGLVGIKQSRAPYRKKFDAVPGIEVANLAVNEIYKKKHKDFSGIGFMVFNDFILPKVEAARKIIGVKILYCYALPHEKLIERYHDYGFAQLASYQQRFIEKRFQPKYDRGCVFMYQNL